MSLEEKVQALVRRAESGAEEDAPTAEELREVRRELTHERQVASGRLKRLRDGRREIAAQGTAADLAEADEAIEEAERRAFQAEARAEEMKRLEEQLAEREALAGVSEMVEELEAALAVARRTRAEHRAATSRLAAAASHVSSVYSRYGSRHARQMPKLARQLVDDVNFLLGGSEGAKVLDVPTGYKPHGVGGPTIPIIVEEEDGQEVTA